MENEICKKKTTAPDTSVGADDGQPLPNSTEISISAFEEEINGDFQNSTESLDELYRRMQRLTDPHYLHMISMTELYQNVYQSRPPIIDGLLYAGAYILSVIHADERNRAMSDALGQDVYHYHIHVVYIPGVEKQVLWSKRCKDESLRGTVKETIQQVSMSKKWNPSPH